jgi:hypothetical protein
VDIGGNVGLTCERQQQNHRNRSERNFDDGNKVFSQDDLLPGFAGLGDGVTVKKGHKQDEHRR